MSSVPATPATPDGIQPNTGLQVVQASYGVAPNFQDVTAETAALVQNGSLNFTVSPQSLGILDPAPGVTKTFQLKTVINGGLPNILSKNDGEVFNISAPGVASDKKSPSHVFNIFTAFWYFLCALFIAYFSVSAYQLGAYGFKSPIVGYLFGAITLITFGMFELVWVPIIIFVYSLTWPDGITFDYALPQV